MEEKLIEKVGEHETLYNTDSPNYRDQKARIYAWKEVAKELNLPASKCREMWSKLRNCYTNAIKRRIIAKSGQNPKKYPKWKYEDQMSFLVPFMVMKTTPDSNLSDTSETTFDNQTEKFLDETSQPNDPDFRNHGSYEFYACSPSNTSQKRKKPTELTAEEMFQILESNNSIQKEKEIKRKIDTTLDSTEMFYLSMAKIVQKLPIVEQARIRMELCRLVSEAEIRNSSNIQHSLITEQDDDL